MSSIRNLLTGLGVRLGFGQGLRPGLVLGLRLKFGVGAWLGFVVRQRQGFGVGARFGFGAWFGLGV